VPIRRTEGLAFVFNGRVESLPLRRFFTPPRAAHFPLAITVEVAADHNSKFPGLAADCVFGNGQRPGCKSVLIPDWIGYMRRATAAPSRFSIKTIRPIIGKMQRLDNCIFRDVHDRFGLATLIRDIDASVQTAAIQKSRSQMWASIRLRRLPRYWTK
jgi:hypothetical protein